MNVYSAINGLRNDGDAVRPTSWRGYVKRVDLRVSGARHKFTVAQTEGTPPVDQITGTSAIPAYNPDQASVYAAGSSVIYNNQRYINPETVAVDGGTSKVGPFDSSKWTRVSFDFEVHFVDAEDATPTTDNPAAVYAAVVSLDGTKYVRWRGTNEQYPSPSDMPDSYLFRAFVSDSWESGSAADFERQRAGGQSGRW